MKKPTAAKKAAQKKNAVHTEKATLAKKTTNSSATPYEPIEEQPQSQEQAATQAGVFLYTDDRWSMAYFDPSDLHYKERELFG
jgi:hypothetical protein